MMPKASVLRTRTQKSASFSLCLLYHLHDAGKMLFHLTNMIPMYHAIIPCMYFRNERFTLVEIPLSTEDHYLGIISPNDFPDMDLVDYTPNNVPQLRCNELEYMTGHATEENVDITIPLWSQDGQYNHQQVSFTLSNGCIESNIISSDKKLVLDHIFLFYVKHIDILLIGDYQGLDAL